MALPQSGSRSGAARASLPPWTPLRREPRPLSALAEADREARVVRPAVPDGGVSRGERGVLRRAVVLVAAGEIRLHTGAPLRLPQPVGLHGVRAP